MGSSLGTGFGTSPKNDPAGGAGVPPFPAGAANNGLSVDPATKLIVLGNGVGSTIGKLLSERYLPMNGFGLNITGTGTGTAAERFNFDHASLRMFGMWEIPQGRWLEIPTSNFAIAGIGNFNFTLSSTNQAPDPANNVLMWGYNQDAGGGIANIGDSSVHFAIESYYAPSLGSNWKEVHMPQINFLPTIPGNPFVSVRAQSLTIKMSTPATRDITTDYRSSRYNWNVLQSPIANGTDIVVNAYTMNLGGSGVLAITGSQPKFQLVDTGTGGIGTVEQNTDLEITSTRNIKLNSNGNLLTTPNQQWILDGGFAINTNVNFGQALVVNDNAGAGQSVGILQVNRLGNELFNVRSSGNTLLGGGVDNGNRLQVNGQINTADPGAGIGFWRLGKVVAAASALDTTRYVQVMIDGVVVKLAVIT